MLLRLARHIPFIPVTTRSLEQYRRIEFGLSAPPPFALVSNGGILLENGQPSHAWYEQTQACIAPALPELEIARALLEQLPYIELGPRMVDGIFVFAKTSALHATWHAMACELDLSAVFIDSVGEKIYVFPKVLHKGFALQRLRKQLGAAKVFSAGDSAFDIPLLLEADIPIIPDEALLRDALSGKCGCYIASCEHRYQFGDAVLNYILTAAALQENA